MANLIEIVVIVVIAYLYYTTAKAKNRDTIVWTIVGIVCYYLPIFIMNQLIWKFIGIQNLFIIVIANIILGVVVSMGVKKAVLDQR